MNLFSPNRFQIHNMGNGQVGIDEFHRSLAGVIEQGALARRISFHRFPINLNCESWFYATSLLRSDRRHLHQWNVTMLRSC